MDDELFEQEPDIISDIVDQTHGDGGREVVPEPTASPIKAFGLASQPFADNVNPEYFFRTEAHEGSLPGDEAVHRGARLARAVHRH